MTSRYASGWTRRPAVDRTAGAVEDAPDQIDSDGGASDLAPGANARVGQVQAGCARQHLDDDPLSFDREHLAPPDLSVGRDHVDELVVADPLDALREQQRPSHVRHGPMLDGEELRPALDRHSSSNWLPNALDQVVGVLRLPRPPARCAFGPLRGACWRRRGRRSGRRADDGFHRIVRRPNHAQHRVLLGERAVRIDLVERRLLQEVLPQQPARLEHDALGGGERVGAEQLHDLEQRALALQEVERPGALAAPVHRDLAVEPGAEFVERVAAVPVDRGKVPLAREARCRAPRTSRQDAGCAA